LMADPKSGDLQWMQLVILDLKNADYKAYRSDVAEMFKRFSGSTDPWSREKLAKVSLLAPEPIELTRALALAESAAVGAGEVKHGEWLLLAHGMALYRAGRYDEAISQLIATRDKASTENEEACECTSQLFLAMAHARLRHESQARAELDRGVHLLIADDVRATEGRWHDWIASQVIYREAETVLLSPSTPTGKGLVPAPIVTMSIDQAFGLAKAGRISEAVPALRQALMTEAKAEDIQWMFRKFGHTSNNRWVAERLAKASLLGPEPVELARAMALAESAAAEGAKEKYGEWFMLTRGIALYRSARYDDAIRQLVEAREKSSSENNASCECTCQLFLAMAHARLKHDTLARAEFERGVRLLPPENQTESAGSWFDWFGAQVVHREAEAVLKGPTAPIVKPSSSSTLTREQIDAMFGEGYSLAITNRTQEAAASYRKALKVDPESDYQWLRLVMLDAKNADAEAYNRDCTDILAQFGNTTDPSVAERVSKCLLIAPSQIDIKRVQQLAELAGNHGKGMEDGGWFLLVHGMWLYRAGQFEDAVRELIAARDKTPDDAVRCRSLVHFFLAMSYGRLNRTGPANEEFKIGLDLLKTHGPKDDQKDLDGNWHDWFAAQAGRREAEALLKLSTK
jgi:tetratricopeptide (TPR) repeat protein